MINEKFVVDKAKAPPHTGAQVLARSVNQLLRYNTSIEARYRIRKMQTHAFSWSDAYNGAYTWARLGYNARLEEISPGLKDTLLKAAQSPDYSNDLRQAIAEVETLNDLILVDGAELWRKYNQEFWGKFYLSPDSDSVAILLRYIKTKGVVI